MLYKTHQKYGQLSGLIGIPIAVTAGFIPVISLGMRFSDAIQVIVIFVVALLGAMFGAEFPDCDSYGGKMANGQYKKGSIPSQKHPVISKLFRMFKVKHRGKFSHDYASLFVFFALIYVANHFGTLHLMKQIANGAAMYAGIAQGLVLFISYLIADEIATRLKFLLKMNRFGELVAKVVLFVGISALLYVAGFVNPLALTSIVVSIKSATFYASVSKVFILFTFIGSYSHLFADMMTNEGVNLFGMRLAPAKVVLKLKKIPLIGPFLLKSNLKTGSPYEDACRTIVTILIIPAFALSIFAITGGDVSEVFRVLGLIA